MQQYTGYFQRIRQARIESRQRHTAFLRNVAGATYRHELGQCQVEKHVPIALRPTAFVPVVKPSAHTERHTDEYNLKNLSLPDMVALDVILHQYRYHQAPSTLTLSPENLARLIALGYGDIYKLEADKSLDNNTIRCS